MKDKLVENVYWHVGLHKTATTWVQEGMLSEHPQISLINNPSAPWDNPVVSYIVDTPKRTYDPDELQARLYGQIEKHVEGATRAVVVSAERLSGHPISGHYDRFTIARRIKKTVGHPKLLVTLRNPVNLIPSIYQQLVKEGYSGTFGQLLREPSWKRPSFDLSAYDFDEMVSNYYDVMGSSSVKVFLFEDLKKNAENYLGKWAEEIGVKNFAPSNMETESNTATSPGQTAFLAATNDFRPSPLNPHPTYDLRPLVNRFGPMIKKVLTWNGNDYVLSIESLNLIKDRLPNYSDIADSIRGAKQRGVND